MPKRPRDQDSDPALDLAFEELIIDIVSLIAQSCTRDSRDFGIHYDRRRHKLELTVSSKDRGVLIGREARTLDAINDALEFAIIHHQRSRSTSSVELTLPLIEFKKQNVSSRNVSSRDERPGR
jgi:predicted RNA-binding protein YlqC (UPF0109 family)